MVISSDDSWLFGIAFVIETVEDLRSLFKDCVGTKALPDGNKQQNEMIAI